LHGGINADPLCAVFQDSFFYLPAVFEKKLQFSTFAQKIAVRLFQHLTVCIELANNVGLSKIFLI
jgi:hypothetical protein